MPHIPTKVAHHYSGKNNAVSQKKATAVTPVGQRNRATPPTSNAAPTRSNEVQKNSDFGKDLELHHTTPLAAVTKSVQLGSSASMLLLVSRRTLQKPLREHSRAESNSIPIGAIIGGAAAAFLTAVLLGVSVIVRKRRNASRGNPEMAKVSGQFTKMGTEYVAVLQIVSTGSLNIILNNSFESMLGDRNPDKRLSTASTLQGEDMNLPVPHWLFSRLAGPTRMTFRSVPYEGPLCAVVKGYKPDSDDELALDPGHLVELKHIFRDGWGVGVNLDTGLYGAMPLTCLEFAGHMLPNAPNTGAPVQAISRRVESSTWARSPTMVLEHDVVSRRGGTSIPSSMLGMIASGKQANGKAPSSPLSQSDAALSGRTMTQPASVSSATTYMTTQLSASIVSVYSGAATRESAPVLRPVPLATRETAEPAMDGPEMDVRGPFPSGSNDAGSRRFGSGTLRNGPQSHRS
ncbi:hypothetical protein HDU93_006289 [Gonapodya sp. JEL0774]|nr:hypothetical protein HDU93_006289 [Gonapodya sp. JEL0774]